MIQGPLNQIALCGGGGGGGWGGGIFLILKISYYEQTPFFPLRSEVQINEGLDWVVPLKCLFIGNRSNYFHKNQRILFFGFCFLGGLIVKF